MGLRAGNFKRRYKSIKLTFFTFLPFLSSSWSSSTEGKKRRSYRLYYSTKDCAWTLKFNVVERSSKYYLVKHLLLSLFDIIDSDKIPQNTKKRTSPLNHHGSTSSPHYDSSPSSSVTSIPYSNTNITVNNRLQRLTTYSSVTRSSYGAFSTQSPDAANEILELILRCLRKCGEDDGFLPLFKVVFGSLGGTEENRYTRRLDGRGRDILLTGVITRMVKYVSEIMPLVLICDDVQCKLPRIKKKEFAHVVFLVNRIWRLFLICNRGGFCIHSNLAIHSYTLSTCYASPCDTTNQGLQCDVYQYLLSNWCIRRNRPEWTGLGWYRRYHLANTSGWCNQSKPRDRPGYTGNNQKKTTTRKAKLS